MNFRTERDWGLDARNRQAEVDFTVNSGQHAGRSREITEETAPGG